jgi:hypothetical protein
MRLGAAVNGFDRGKAEARFDALLARARISEVAEQ